MSISENSIRLTQRSHGADCDCKISPKVLETTLYSKQAKLVDPNLFMGNEARDDAAVYDLGNGTSVIDIINFSMPIVDNPFDFDRITAANAISDIFAVGGKPITTIAILGWLVNKPSPEITHEVTKSGRYACHQAGTALADSHSTDAPESISGLAVAGIVPTERVKKNSTVQAGCKLFLTKPLGVGVLTTAEKESLLKSEHQGLATEVTCRANIADTPFVNIEGVRTMAGVTGFGLLGHLSGMCQGADVQVHANYDVIPKLPGVEGYIELGVVPSGTERSFADYSHLMGEIPRKVRNLLYDPQASGGLLLAVISETENEVKATAVEFGIELTAIDELMPARGGRIIVEIC